MATLTANGALATAVAASGTANTGLAANGAVATAVSAGGTATLGVSFRGNVTLPLLTSTGQMENGKGFSGSVELPQLTVSGTCVNGAIYSGAMTLPFLTMEAYGPAFGDITLPSLTMTGIICPGSTSTADITLPGLSISASMTNAVSYVGDNTLPLLSCSGTLVGGTVSTASLTLPMFRIVTDSLAGNTYTSAITLPTYTMEAEAYSQGFLTVDVDLPMFIVSGDMTNASALTVTSWAMNTENLATSNYINYDYLELGAWNGGFYGVKADGVYQFNAAKDGVTDIDAEFETGFEDFGTENYKNVPHAYVGHESDGAMQLSVIVDGEASERTYSVVRKQNATGITHGRVTLARGVNSRYWKLGMNNVAGADFTVDTIGVLPKVLQRKT